jgi:hypothetical protein
MIHQVAIMKILGIVPAHKCALASDQFLRPSCLGYEYPIDNIVEF